jgi:hypothetical protein
MILKIHLTIVLSLSTDTRFVQVTLAWKFGSSRITSRHLEFYAEKKKKKNTDTSEALYFSEVSGLLDPGDIGISIHRNVVNHLAVETA